MTKILLFDKGLTKLKAFTDNNFNVPQMVQYFFDTVENIVEKGEITNHYDTSHL